MTIYEMHGRLAEQLETEQAAHRDTVQVLIALKAGALRLDQVDVDAGAMTWATFPDREPPAAAEVTLGSGASMTHAGVTFTGAEPEQPAVQPSTEIKT